MKAKEPKLTKKMLQHHIWVCLQHCEQELLNNRPIQAYQLVKDAKGWLLRYRDENPNGTR